MISDEWGPSMNLSLINDTMSQMLAMALACEPALLIADEPTTALDMMTQASILALLRELREALGMTLLLVAHDLAVVGELCDDVVVLYAGQVVERGPAASVLRAPSHPYTKALLASVPPLKPPARRRGEKGPRLPVIEGRPGDARERPTGCRFRDRCTVAVELCARDMPDLLPLARHRDDPAGESLVRCFVARDAAADIARMGSPS